MGWSLRRVSLLGKSRVANIFLLSCMWYLAHIVPFSSDYFKKLARIIQRWLWGDSSVPAMSMTRLAGGRRWGRAGLLDPAANAALIFSKWLVLVMAPWLEPTV